MTSHEKLAAIFAEEKRIGKERGELWPESQQKMSTDEYIVFLKRIPDGTGLKGYLKCLAEFDGG